LVKKIYNFSRNLITSEKKLKKFYLTSPSLSSAFSEFIEKGRLVENLLISLKNYKFFWRDAYQHEIDFINAENKKIIPIEVKYKKEIGKKDLKNLIIFARKYGSQRAIIFWKNIVASKEKIKDLKIERLPVYFIL